MVRTAELAGAIVLLGLSIVIEGGPAGLGGFVLNTRFGRIQIQPTILDVLIDLLGCLQKSLFNILAPETKSHIDILHHLVTIQSSFSQKTLFFH